MEAIAAAFKSKKNVKPPKTVFKPSRKLIRKMIRAVVEFGGENETKFLLRFAFVAVFFQLNALFRNKLWWPLTVFDGT